MATERIPDADGECVHRRRCAVDPDRHTWGLGLGLSNCHGYMKRYWIQREISASNSAFFQPSGRWLTDCGYMKRY